jgi:pyrroloquinoline quinone biosynthesis protein B
MRRTQSSVAISSDDRWWFLLNVSPDIRQQVLAFPQLGPPEQNKRGTAIAGCILTDAELDHTSGLLQLREGCSFSLFSTHAVRSWLNESFPIERIVASFAERPWHEFDLDAPFELTLPDGSPTGLVCRALETDRGAPRFVPGEPAAPGAVIGLVIQDTLRGGKLAYVPCTAHIDSGWKSQMEQVNCLLFDGTFWSDDEPRQWDISHRSATEMGHIPVDGSLGSLSWMGRLSMPHRAYVHINNTNPMLDRCSEESAKVRACGVRIAEDGDEFVL